MIPEIGEFALIIALFISVVLAFIPMYGAATRNLLWMSYAQPLAKGLFFFLLMSFLCLGYAFSHDDFSVIYVAN